MSKELVLFFDCGDTLVDESTQMMNDSGDVISARLFEGAREMLMCSYHNGYRMALVADGRVASFRNIFRELGLEHLFEKWIISEELGQEKPARIMFETAMEQMGLSGQDAERIVMIGNNIKRDILGANQVGIRTILQSETPRYPMEVDTPEEMPDYIVASSRELIPLLDELERQIQNKNRITIKYK